MEVVGCKVGCVWKVKGGVGCGKVGDLFEMYIVV